MKRRRPSAKASAAVPSMDYRALVAAIQQAHDTAQRQAVQAVNVALALRNWLVGYYIVEYEQHGRDRARYGERLLEDLARDLRGRMGRGFTKRYLELFRQFYLRYPIAKSLISQFAFRLPYPSTVPFEALDWQDDAYFARLFRELTWTHLIELIRMDDPLKRAFCACPRKRSWKRSCGGRERGWKRDVAVFGGCNEMNLRRGPFG